MRRAHDLGPLARADLRLADKVTAAVAQNQLAAADCTVEGTFLGKDVLDLEQVGKVRPRFDTDD